MVVVDLCKNGFTGSEFPFESVAVRTGAALGALVLTVEQAGNCSRRFNAVAGQEYKIQVDYRNSQGNFTFRLRQLVPPVNANFASALVIGPSLPINLNSSNVDSGWQAGEPAVLGGHTHSRPESPNTRARVSRPPVPSGTTGPLRPADGSPSRPAARTTALVSASIPESP